MPATAKEIEALLKRRVNSGVQVSLADTLDPTAPISSSLYGAPALPSESTGAVSADQRRLHDDTQYLRETFPLPAEAGKFQTTESPQDRNIQAQRDYYGPGDAFLPSSTTHVMLQDGYVDTQVDDARKFLKQLNAGAFQGLTGIDILDEDERGGVGFTVGQVIGFTGSFIPAMRGARFIGQAFRRLGPIGRRIVQQAIAGGTIEGFQQGLRGVVGQSVDPEEIPKTALLFGGTEAGLLGIGRFGRSVWRNAYEGGWKVNTPSIEKITPGPVRRVTEWFRRTHHDVVKRGFFQSRNLLKSKTGRQIVAVGDRMIDDIGIREGKMREALREAGLFRLSRRERGQLTDVLRVTDKRGFVDTSSLPSGMYPDNVIEAASSVRKVLNKMLFSARGSGIEAGYLDNYVPSVLKRDVAEVIYGDLRKKLRAIAGQSDDLLEAGMTLSDRNLSKRLRDQIANMKFERATERAIEHIMKTGKVDRYKAIALLERHTGDNLYMPFSNLDFHRTLQLPLDFYEQDAVKILEKYVDGWARRVSGAQAFGVRGEKAYKMLDAIAKEAPDELIDAKEVIQGLLRVTERSKAISNPTLRKLSSAYVNFRVGTAIGLGFATIPNMTQTLISTYRDHGLVRTTKGLAALFTKGGRKWVRKSGSTWVDTHRMMFGVEGEGPLSNFSRVTTTVFNAVNTVNKALAATTAGVAIPEYHATAQGSGWLARIARKRLKQMGVDWRRPLKNDDILRGMNRFANNSQLHKHVLNEPLWMNNPRLRPFVLFKRFGYRQATYTKDNVLKEFYIDPMPLMRMVAGGAVGGWAVDRARRELRDFISGERRWEPDRPFWQEVINAYAAAGTVGMLTDMADIFESDNWAAEAYDNLAFTITPILMDDILKSGKLIDYTLTTKDRHKLRAVSSKFVKYYGGSMMRYSLGQRLETPQQTRSRRSYLRGRRR